MSRYTDPARRRTAGVLSLTALAIVLAADVVRAQRDRTPRWRIDPYTRNDPRLMERAGYVSYAPFGFGQRGNKPTTTEEIEAHFEDELEILWVETEHFKIGLNLPPWNVPNELPIRRRIRGELKELKERTGWKIRTTTRVLDPWLRLHLTAQRLENHYDTFLEWLGREDDDFPGNDETWNGTDEYMGQGPYLGMEGKYLFLVFERDRDYSDYLLAFTGLRSSGGQRWHFKEGGNLLYSVALDVESGRLRDDTALFCNLIFNATHNFIDGYKHYNYDLPVWIREGVAHWFEREVDPDWNSFTRSEGTANISDNVSNWRLETRKLIRDDDYTPFFEAYQWRDFGQIPFDDHIAIWSRWDYLMSKGKKPFAEFMSKAAGQISADGSVSGRDVIEAVRNALQDDYGISPLVFDERWKAWVVETYPAR